MYSSTLTELDQGIAAARAGDTATARRLLLLVIGKEDDCALAWLWLSAVVETDGERSYCLGMALIYDPGNPTAEQARQRLPAKTSQISPEGRAYLVAPTNRPLSPEQPLPSRGPGRSATSIPAVVGLGWTVGILPVFFLKISPLYYRILSSYVGLGLALVSSLSLVFGLDRRRWSPVSVGTIVDHHKARYRIGKDSNARWAPDLAYYPIIRFSLQDGTTLEFQGLEPGEESWFPLGAACKVQYDPTDPAQVRIPLSPFVWLIAVVIGLIGVAMFVLPWVPRR